MTDHRSLSAIMLETPVETDDQLGKVLTPIAAVVAHEINQPLSGIAMNIGTCLRLLACDPPDIEGVRATMGLILRDSSRTVEVVRRMQALYSQDAKIAEPLDLNEVTAEAIELVMPDLQQNRVNVCSQLTAEPLVVVGDRIQLQQVIINMLRNATEAMVSVTDRLLHICVQTRRDKGLCVVVSVQDTGTGLITYDTGGLFDPFYSTKGTGRGVGLTVSRAIVESHGGRMWAEPNDGPGAKFSFLLPCYPGASSNLAGSNRQGI